MLLVAGALAGARSLNEVAVEAFGAERPGGPAPDRRARLRASCTPGSLATTTSCSRRSSGSALRCGAADLALARAGGSVWELAAAGFPRSSSPTRTRRPTTRPRTRSYFERAGGAVVVPELGARRAPRRRALAARGRTASSPLCARRCSALARPDAAEEIAEELIALAGRSRVDASGSSGSAARACPATRCSRMHGGPRSAAGTASRRPISRTPRRRDRRVDRARAGRARRVGGDRLVRLSTSPARAAPSSSPSSSRLQRSIVVAGAHGKTTTTAMIAFVLDRLGLDPAFLIGGDVPQLGANAGAGRAGSSSRVTSRTGRSRRSGRRSRSCTNVELDHHATFGSLAEVQALFDALARPRAERRARSELEPVRLRTRAARRAQPAERGRCARRARAGRRGPRGGRAAPCASSRRGAPLRAAGAARRARLRRLRPPPGRGRRGARCGARARAGSSARPLPAAPLLAHAASRARARPRALSAADAVAVTDVYAAREEPVQGVSGKLVVDALTEFGRGCRSRGRRGSRTACGSSPGARGPATSC